MAKRLGAVQRRVLEYLVDPGTRLVNLGWGHRVHFHLVGGKRRQDAVPWRVVDSLLLSGLIVHDASQDKYSKDWIITDAGREALRAGGGE